MLSSLRAAAFLGLQLESRLYYLPVRCISNFTTPISVEQVAGSLESNVFIPKITEEKLLKVAIIGMPNAGKSTFINNIMDRKVCPASSKVHTTRSKATAIFTEGNAQIVFLDTPGIVTFQEKQRFNLGRSFLKDGKQCLQDADLIGVVHDAGNQWTREKLDIKVIKLLEEFKAKTSFLVLNKVDLLKSKRKLLTLTRQVTENCLEGKPVSDKPLKDLDGDIKGWPYFEQIFMVSSLSGSGIQAVKKYLIDSAKSGQWLFPSETWTDQKTEDIITNSVKATLLDYLPQEIPYSLETCMEFFETDVNGVIKTVVLIRCPSQRIAKLVAGDGDGKLRQITASVQQDLQETFYNQVRIRLVVESK